MNDAGSLQRPRRRWVWVLVALVTATVLGVPFARGQAIPKVDDHHAFVAPVSYLRDVAALRVQADEGTVVTIRAGRPGQVTESSVSSWAFRKPAIRQTWQGGSFVVSVTCPKPMPLGQCQANVIIAIPAGTAVQAQAGGGTVTVSGLTGPLHLAATSGLLIARDVSGPFWATVTSGSMDARTGLTSSHFSASAVTGLLTLAFATRPQRLTIGVGTGSAVITVPSGSQYHIVSSHGPGAVSVAPGLSDARSGQVIAVRVGDGAATIGYPPRAPH
jgi:hypothetical protein